MIKVCLHLKKGEGEGMGEVGVGGDVMGICKAARQFMIYYNIKFTTRHFTHPFSL